MRRAAAAARPQAAVKETAWQQVVEDDTLANIIGRSIIGGFVQPGQGELLAPFTARYFDGDPRRVGAALQRGRADGRHRPVPVVGHQPGRLAAADRFLRRARSAAVAAPAGARRSGRVERSLRARKFDGDA